MYNFPQLIKITFQKSLLLFFVKQNSFLSKETKFHFHLFSWVYHSHHTQRQNLVERIIAVDYTTLPHQNKKCLF